MPTTLTNKEKSITCTLATNPEGKYSQYTLTSDQPTAIPYNCSKVPQPKYWIKIQNQYDSPLKDGLYLTLDVNPATSEKTPVIGYSTVIDQATKQLNSQYWMIGDTLYNPYGTQECSKPIGKPNPLQDVPYGIIPGQKFITITANTPEVITYICQ